jgi:hypothetical protein
VNFDVGDRGHRCQLRVIAGSNRDLPSSSAMPLEADVRRAAGLLLVFLDHAVVGIFDFAVEVGRPAGLFVRDGHEAEGILQRGLTNRVQGQDRCCAFHRASGDSSRVRAYRFPWVLG